MGETKVEANKGQFVAMKLECGRGPRDCGSFRTPFEGAAIGFLK
jgi:hypothetical protein